MKKIISTMLAFVMLIGTVTIGVPEDGLIFGFGLKAYAEGAETSPSDLPASSTDVSGTDVVTTDSDVPAVSDSDVPVPDDPADTEIASGKCGDNLTWTLTPDGTLTISGTGAMYDWSGESSMPGYEYRGKIKDVVIKDGVTNIGNNAFFCCSVKSVSIPESVTSIGEMAFYACEGIESMVIPDSVTSIGVGAFAYCVTLESINIPKDISKIEVSAFSDCISLKEISVPAGVTEIGAGAFRSCSELESIDIPDGVASIREYTFIGCHELESINIPKSVKSVNESAFEACAALTDVYYGGSRADWAKIDFISDSDYYPCPVTSANIHYAEAVQGVCGDNLTWTLTADGTLTISGTGAMYDWTEENPAPWHDYATEIKEVVIPDGVTSIGGSAFRQFGSVKSIILPSSVASIGDYAFTDCIGMTSVNIPYGVTSIGNYVFAFCHRLADITIPDSVTSIGDSAFYCCFKLTNVVIPDSVTTIGRESFYTCDSLESITIPSSVVTIGESAFWLCEALTDVYYGGTEIDWARMTIGENNDDLLSAERHCVPVVASGECGDALIWVLTEEGELIIVGSGAMDNWNDEGNYAPWFSHRSDIKSVEIDGAATIGSYAFYGCNKLTGISISDSVASIGDWAFYSCESLTDITIPEGVKSIGDDAFTYCTSLTGITVPSSVESIGEFPFYACEKMTAITVAAGNSHYSSIDGVLYNKDATLLLRCPVGIKGSVTIPSTVTGFDRWAFACCVGLTDIEVDNDNKTYSSIDGVMYTKDATELVKCPEGKEGTFTVPDGVVRIGEKAFQACGGLNEVVLPDGVTSIGNFAFCECWHLNSINFPDGMKSIGDHAFAENYELTAINIPASVETIGEYGFGNCQGLADVYYDGTKAQWDNIAIGDENEFLLGARLHCHLANGKCGKDLTWELTEDGKLTISGSGKMYSWSADSDVPWHDGHSQIKTVEIEGATTIGSHAFYNCGYLESVTIPDSVTDIGDSAFSYCYSLKSITIPDSVTSINSHAFAYCESLESVVIPDSVTSINGYAFVCCTSLVSVEIPNSVTSINGSAFKGCTSLASVEIPNSVAVIYTSAFSGCTSLTSVTIPYSVRSISNSAFLGAIAIKDVYYIGTEEEWGEVDIGSDNDPIHDANIHFEPSDILCSGWCGPEARYTLERSGKLTITGSGEMSKMPWSSYRSQIKEVEISGVTTIGDSAFSGCDALISITIPDSVTTIGGSAFYNCDSLESITIGDSVTTIGESAFGDCGALNTVSIPNSVTAIETSAFNYCRSLKTVYYSGIESDWDAITVGTNNDYLLNATIYYGVSDLIAKGECGDLEWELSKKGVLTVSGSDVIPDYSAESPAPWNKYASLVQSAVIGNGVTGIGSFAFESCVNLTEVDIPDSVTSIGDAAFMACEKLMTVEVPKNVTYIGSDAFMDCVALTAITVDDENTKYKDIDGVLFNKSGTAILCCPAAKSGEYAIPDGVTLIGDNAFYACTKITSVTLPDGVKSIGDWAFAYCNSLASINIPESVSSLGEAAFTGCKSLESITIPEGVASIGADTFAGCIALESVGIPASVTQIGKSAFADCSALTNVYYAGSSAGWGEMIISSYNSALASAKVHCAVADGDLTIETADESVQIVIPDGETEVTADTELNVDPVLNSTGETEAVFAVLDELGEKFSLFDITLTEDGEKVQPSGEVTVRIKVPEGYNAESCRVYHVSNDGTAQNMNAVVEDGYFVFTTDHFSYYAIVQLPVRLPGDTNSDGAVDMKDSTVLRRYLAGWDVTIDEANADVNGDGKVNLLDSTILRRNLAGWEGVELK